MAIIAIVTGHCYGIFRPMKRDWLCRMYPPKHQLKSP